MPKFFVFSDVHSFYDELQKSLEEVGYDKDNPDHWLISCGDNWDGGRQPFEAMRFLFKSPRTILIRGNHEDLFEDMITRGYPFDYDKSNGTVDTVHRISGKIDFAEACDVSDSMTRFFLAKMRNYFETEHYVFTHGWIPTDRFDVILPNWRKAGYEAWNDARWRNGIQMALERKSILEDKTVVCGHWNTSWGHLKKGLEDGSIDYDDYMTNCLIEKENYYLFGKGANFEPFYDKGIIAIDGCTVMSGKVNVVVLEDEFLEGEAP